MHSSEGVDFNKNSLPKLKDLNWKWKDLVWTRVAKLIFMHVQFPYGLYLFLFVCKGYTAWFSKHHTKDQP